MPSINGPIPQKWRDYVTQVDLGLEEVPSVLYSTKAYTSGTTQVLTFFDTVAGARPDLTNMQTPNAMPNPESFLIENIRFLVKDRPQSDSSGGGAGAAVASQFDDVVQLVINGILSLKIGNKQYGPWPLWMLPAQSFVKGAFATGSDLLADYGQTDGSLYYLEPNLMLAPIQPFTVTIAWPAGALTLTGSPDLQVLFDGKLARAIQ